MTPSHVIRYPWQLSDIMPPKKTPRRLWINKEDAQRLEEGSFYRSYEKLGAHPDKEGVWFAVWAPGADGVSVLGEFNDWESDAHPLQRRKGGVWETYVPGARSGQKYKYRITRGMYTVDKTDPYAFAMEPPVTGGDAASGLASIICDLDYAWDDKTWLEQRCGPDSLNRPISIYEVHLGSWRKQGMYSMSYRDIAKPLADHVEELGFTHVEFMPVMEHPFYGSWGYQVAGYYAPTYRYGSPADFKYLVDYLHRRGIGVLLDWVPAHFATDPQALVFFDGSTLYEYDDPGMRRHPDWGTYVFDYNKPGVRNFLISNALFWIEEYHIDGLRFDAVASMLYRDYSRGKEWSPNLFGGRENLEAIDLLKKVNEVVYTHAPDVLMIAEESTAWPGVSKPTYDGGLGFLYKWNMGWMHDTLEYMEKDPVHRKHHQDRLTFPLLYTYSEHYILPLSHDEVVHGKGIALGQNAGGCLAKGSESAPPVRAPDRASGKETALHGIGVRTDFRMGPRPCDRLERPERSAAQRHDGMGKRPVYPVSQSSGALERPARRVRMDRLRRPQRQHGQLHPALDGPGTGVPVQFHAGPSHGLPHRDARQGPLAGTAQLRCADIRRRRRRQPW